MDIFSLRLVWQVRQRTVSMHLQSVWVGLVELVDSCGSLQPVWGETPTVIKVVPTPGWLTSSVIRPAMFLPVASTWATVAKVTNICSNSDF